MPTYFFLLGQTPALSKAELESVFPDQTLDMVLPDIASVTLPSDTDAQQAMDILGGSTKIARLVTTLDHPTDVKLKEELLAILSTTSKVTFAIGEIGRDHLPVISESEIKQLLHDKGISSRFVGQSRHGLSAAVLLHQSVTELLIIQNQEHLFIAQTVAVQDIDNWTERDRHKPYADRKKGMLPPKVARMMVNIAMSNTNPSDHLLYDPFCGTGTVLLEAAMRGAAVIGSDLDPIAVAGTQDNLDWLTRTYNLEAPAPAFQGDAAHVTLAQLPKPVTMLVTEPFLGKPRPNLAAVANIIKGLEKMYLGVFKNWQHILADGATVVVVFPVIPTPRHTYTLESMIDKLKDFGYTTAFEPIMYYRPQATVQRQIIKFVFKK